MSDPKSKHTQESESPEDVSADRRSDTGDFLMENEKQEQGPQPFVPARRVPVIAMRGIVIFPGSSLSFGVGRESSIRAIKLALLTDQQLLLVSQKDTDLDEPGEDDLYEVGTLVRLRRVLENSDGYKILCEGMSRARVISYNTGRDGVIKADIETIPEKTPGKDQQLRIAALKRETLKAFEEFAEKNAGISPDSLKIAKEMKDISPLANLLILNMDLSIEEKQEQLEEVDPVQRLTNVLELLYRENTLIDISREINGQVQNSMEQNQKEYYLREQLRFIREELGENSEEREADELRRRLAESGMSEEIKRKVEKEIARLERMPGNFPETSVQRNWIELLLDLPFGKTDQEKLSLDKARKILDQDHYGLKKVKERILEYVAVRSLQVRAGEVRIRGPILCLVGPPGVGKTSIARSIANALGRRYVRMSLGGIHDEAEIRGHRRTYVGAMPGRIIQGMRQAGVDNPLFLLDEIDKLGGDFRGDPSSALLEVLDPEQNNNFRDHYVEVPYDLSQVIFITTANSAFDIPEPLLDRMELIELPGYTDEEKKEIAKRHLLPRQLRDHALTKEQLRITPAGMQMLISGYTAEAGVRQLERELAHICRRAAVLISEGEAESITVKPKDLQTLLGKQPFLHERAEKQIQIGVVRGLAWTAAGGDTLTIEANALPGSGKLELTGQLGDIMKESAKAAVTYIRSRAEELNIKEDFFSTSDIHIHVPAGAVPKDGPSAGITLATALASAITGRPVRNDLGMTGEITLRGRILPIGGLKEKAVAAKRAGLKEILIPIENERDIDEIPESVRKTLKITPVRHMDEVLKAALI